MSLCGSMSPQCGAGPCSHSRPPPVHPAASHLPLRAVAEWSSRDLGGLAHVHFSRAPQLSFHTCLVNRDEGNHTCRTHPGIDATSHRRPPTVRFQVQADPRGPKWISHCQELWGGNQERLLMR